MIMNVCALHKYGSGYILNILHSYYIVILAVRKVVYLINDMQTKVSENSNSAL